MSRAALPAAVLLAVMVAVGMQSPAAADEFGFGSVDCEQFPNHPDCQLRAGTPDRPGNHAVSPGGEVTCTWDGEEVPCRDDWGWYGGDGCYYRALEDGPSERDGVPGSAYVPRCIGDPANFARSAVWIPDSQAPGVSLLAQVAVSRLSLPAPQVELSPAPPAAQLVRLPTWLWIAPQWWGERTASASVPGASVTAVGTPVEVQWDMGDGTVETCAGPGTPYGQATAPAEASPDCGHTYTRSSAAQPGETFAVAATVTWEVTWSGAGGSGTEGPLFSTTELDVPVSEVQTVIAP